MTAADYFRFSKVEKSSLKSSYLKILYRNYNNVTETLTMEDFTMSKVATIYVHNDQVYVVLNRPIALRAKDKQASKQAREELKLLNSELDGLDAPGQRFFARNAPSGARFLGKIRLTMPKKGMVDLGQKLEEAKTRKG